MINFLLKHYNVYYKALSPSSFQSQQEEYNLPLISLRKSIFKFFRIRYGDKFEERVSNLL